jgi:hypothetical protein
MARFNKIRVEKAIRLAAVGVTFHDLDPAHFTAQPVRAVLLEGTRKPRDPAEKQTRSHEGTTALAGKSRLRFVVLFGIVSLFADLTYQGVRSVTGPFLEAEQDVTQKDTKIYQISPSHGASVMRTSIKLTKNLAKSSRTAPKGGPPGGASDRYDQHQ